MSSLRCTKSKYFYEHLGSYFLILWKRCIAVITVISQRSKRWWNFAATTEWWVSGSWPTKEVCSGLNLEKKNTNNNSCFRLWLLFSFGVNVWVAKTDSLATLTELIKNKNVRSLQKASVSIQGNSYISSTISFRHVNLSKLLYKIFSLTCCYYVAAKLLPLIQYPVHERVLLTSFLDLNTCNLNLILQPST